MNLDVEDTMSEGKEMLLDRIMVKADVRRWHTKRNQRYERKQRSPHHARNETEDSRRRDVVCLRWTP